MMSLSFSRKLEIVHGRRMRRSCFERRSLLPASAACVVANAMRETLSALLAVPVTLRLLEPVIPDPAAWSALAAQARLYRVRGSIAAAAIVVRPRDALALAAAAFGEAVAEPRPLSPVESEVLLRAVRALSGSLASVIGRDAAALEQILDISGYVTYFELILERPVAARIGIALSRDPVAKGPGGTLRIEDLLDVEIELSAEFAAGEMAAMTFLDLRPGALVPMMTKIGMSGTLKAGGTVLARGECGTLRAQNALIVR
jgi:flagellar motor switch/type III secretory pathway protein FliN